MEELTVGISYGDVYRQIRLWKSEDGTMYCFLPSNSLNYTIGFANLPTDGKVTLDGKTMNHSVNLSKVENLLTSDHELVFAKEGKEEQKAVLKVLCSSQIATLYLDTESGSTEYIFEHQENAEGAMMVLYDEEGHLDYNGHLVSVSGRGNSTFTLTDKKGLSLKFDKDVSLLKMDSGKKWVLLGNPFDDSKIRNKLILDYFREYSSIPASESKYADVYLNGEYVGNYLLCHFASDCVKMDPKSDLEGRMDAVNTKVSRGKIQEYVNEDGTLKGYLGLNEPKDITGGYVIEANGVARDRFRCGFTTNHGIYYEVVYPNNATVRQVEYIRDYMNEVEGALYSEDGINPETGKSYAEYMELQSWAEKYVADQMFADVDKNATNRGVFFYKFSNAVDSRLYTGPAWDYDLSLGRNTFDKVFRDDPTYPVMNTGAYGSILSEKEDVRELIGEYLNNQVSEYIQDDMSACVRDLFRTTQDSVTMDRIRWSRQYGRYESRDAEGDYIRWYFNERYAFLDDLWCQGAEYHTVTFLDQSGNICEQYSVKHGEGIRTIPKVSSLGAIFAGWKSNGEDVLYEGMPVFEDMTFESQWIDIELLLLNGLELGDADLEDIDAETLEALLERVKQLQGNTEEPTIEEEQPTVEEEQPDE
jgi:hypothetical protein